MVVIVKKIRQQHISICIPNCTILQNYLPTSMCAAISQFLYKASHFFIQNAIKIYTKTQQLQHVFQKLRRELSTYSIAYVQLYNYFFM